MPSKTRKTDNVPSDPPTSINPYDTLSISKDATEDQVKKAYRKAALKHHPDKATGRDAATAKDDFQKIAFAYAILSDPRRRKRYDATGSTSESIDLENDDFNWEDFFRAQYQSITREAIENFTKQYKHSDEERQAILDAYKKGKGNMDMIYEMVMASDVLEDDERFRAIIDQAISDEEIQAFDKYTKETDKSKERRIKKAEREAKEAEEAAEATAKETEKRTAKVGKNGGPKADSAGSLAALIGQRQKSRGTSFLDNLEDKYTKLENAKGKKRSATDEGEPSEEAFAATAERYKKSKRRK